jgi:hypothetical protein
MILIPIRSCRTNRSTVLTSPSTIVVVPPPPMICSTPFHHHPLSVRDCAQDFAQWVCHELRKHVVKTSWPSCCHHLVAGYTMVVDMWVGPGRVGPSQARPHGAMSLANSVSIDRTQAGRLHCELGHQGHFWPTCLGVYLNTFPFTNSIQCKFKHWKFISI